MRQPSLYETLGVVAERLECGPGGPPEVYDWFGGAGGFSEGARQAGYRVVWVCDNDPLALKTHAANHPQTEHRLAELPLPRAHWPFPTDGRAFHTHFSPPCQKFSQLSVSNGGAEDRVHATNLIEWSLQTALSSGATSWSLEQVATPPVLKVLERARVRYPGRVAYAKLDFSMLGVPQKRVRLIAGPPALVSRLMRQCSVTKARSVRSAIPLPRGTHVRNGSGWVRRWRGSNGRWCYQKAKWSDSCHAVDGPSPTVLSDRGMNWVTRTSSGYASEHPRLRKGEYAALQTFPPTYRWPETEQLALKQIGNAVPPLVARLLLEAATSSTPASPSLRRALATPRWAPAGH